jgi:ubiquinone/menaquinone biosynthesis C-methylase UbiE
MEKAEFDRIADEYETLHRRNIAVSGESPEFFARYKVKDVALEATRRGVAVRRLLDFGSGTGNSLPHFHASFPEAAITCADVSARSLEISRARFPQLEARHVEIDGPTLPFDDETFDVSFSACVFHHIPHGEHPRWLAELRRVTRKGGLLVIFEHNPLNPLTAKAVRECPFDENAVLIRASAFRRRVEDAGWNAAHAVYRIFFPHLLSFARPAERWLRSLPLGAQYFVCATRG